MAFASSSCPIDRSSICPTIAYITTIAREINSLLIASQELNCDNLTIITFNENKTIKQDNKVVKVATAWKWLLNN